MKQLNEIEAAYVSGFLEKANFRISTYETDFPRGFAVHVVLVANLNTGYLKVLNSILHLEKKYVARNSPLRAAKVTSCTTKKMSYYLQSRPRAIQFTHNELRELLPMLEFKAPYKENYRVIAIQLLETIRELRHYRPSGIGWKKKRNAELESKLIEQLKQVDILDHERLDYIRHKAET